MTTFNTWELPARSIVEQEGEAFRWSTEGSDAVSVGPGRWKALAAKGTLIGEIKPHTASGIGDGWRQLEKRLLAERRALAPGRRGASSHADLSRGVLVTYAKDLRTADAVVVRAAFADARKEWIFLGRWRFEWARLVPLESCTSCLGSRIEGLVRSIVRQRTSLKLDPKPGAQRHGADLIMSLELNEFLAELNAELQAELAEMTNELANELAERAFR